LYPMVGAGDCLARGMPLARELLPGLLFPCTGYRTGVRPHNRT
jgi:hypothetical protein